MALKYEETDQLFFKVLNPTILIPKLVQYKATEKRKTPKLKTREMAIIIMDMGSAQTHRIVMLQVLRFRALAV